MSAEPGWYDDGAGRQRWWDGTAWTDRFRDALAPPPPPPPPPRPGAAYDPKMDAAAAPDLQPKKNGNWILWSCGGCIVIPVALILVLWLIGINSPDKPYDGDNQYEAISQCEERVKALLKSPSTAKFDSSASGSGTWTVNGTVDSENGFGAMLRSSFQCTVVISGDRATTTVDYLE